MKSPSTSPGIIEADGMRKGSTRNERTSRTTRMTGNSERAWATSHGVDAPAFPCLPLRVAASTSKMMPVTASAATNTAEKSKLTGASAWRRSIVQIARCDRRNDARAEYEAVPHEDPGAPPLQIVQQTVDGDEGGDAREHEPDRQRQPALRAQSCLEQHPKLEQTREGDRRQAEQE